MNRSHRIAGAATLGGDCEGRSRTDQRVPLATQLHPVHAQVRRRGVPTLPLSPVAHRTQGYDSETCGTEYVIGRKDWSGGRWSGLGNGTPVPYFAIKLNFFA